MPMTQQDIRRHYERDWKAQSDAAADPCDLSYSNPVEDAVLYPIYEQLIADLNVAVSAGRVLDVGSGSGRWIRFFLDRYEPRRLVGIDFTDAAIDVLRTWHRPSSETSVEFPLADVTEPGLDLGEQFDLVNVANVLFHIPEPELFTRALENLARLVAPAGHIVTTEYLPRATMRTEWMRVRSRYEFEAAIQAAGLRMVQVRATSFFSNDPMGWWKTSTSPLRSTRGQVRIAAFLGIRFA